MRFGFDFSTSGLLAVNPGLENKNKLFATEDFTDSAHWDLTLVSYQQDWADESPNGNDAQEWSCVASGEAYFSQDGMTFGPGHHGMSWYLKWPDGESDTATVRMVLRDETTIDWQYATYSWTTGSAPVRGNTSADYDGAEDVGNGWYRFWLVWADSGNEGNELRGKFVLSTGSDTYDLLVWGAQIEDVGSGTTVTSYQRRTG